MKVCEQFQIAYASRPQNFDVELAAHWKECRECANYAAAIRELDRKLVDSMKFDVPTGLAVVLKAIPNRSGSGNSRWMVFGGFALAASLLLGLALASVFRLDLMTRAVPLQQMVYQHILGEPQALNAIFPVQQAVLKARLKEFGMSLAQPIGNVMFVKLCPVGNSQGLHLVVQGKQGPVTFLFLPKEIIAASVSFSKGRFVGYIKPSGSGIVAVVGEQGETLSETDALVQSSLNWL